MFQEYIVDEGLHVLLVLMPAACEWTEDPASVEMCPVTTVNDHIIKHLDQHLVQRVQSLVQRVFGIHLGELSVDPW